VRGRESGQNLDVALQIAQISLALPIVVTYGLVQFKLMRPDQLSFLLTNLLAAAGLAVTAFLEFQLGFVITNVLWVVVSAAGLRALAQRRLARGQSAS
jgi:predicted cation transporter